MEAGLSLNLIPTSTTGGGTAIAWNSMRKLNRRSNQSLTISKRLRPWYLLLFGMALFYDANPFYQTLLHYGLNLHLPLPKIMDESWRWSTEPRISSIIENPDSRYLSLITDRGEIEVKNYPVCGAKLGVVVAGGIAGAFRSPAGGLFHKLGQSGQSKAIHTVHVCFRKPSEFPETVHDMRAAVHYLNSKGIQKVVVVGHSLGGAAAIGGASFEPSVVGVVPISSQPYGAERISLIQTRTLVITGLLDPIEPTAWSKAIWKEAKGDKQIAFFMGTHNLDECAQEVYERLFCWILDCKAVNIPTRT